jgi:hypothetical protein
MYATTPPNAGRWEAGLADPLRGARVRLLWDHDDAGRVRAWYALDALRAVKARVRCMRAATGKDITDHLAAGLGLKALVREVPEKVQGARRTAAAQQYNGDEEETITKLVDEAGPYAEQVDAVLRLYSALAPEEDPPVYSFDDVLNMEPPDWRVDGLFWAHGLTVVWGIPGSSKSTLLDDWTDAVCRDQDWNGYKVQAGGVFTLAGENLPQYVNRFHALVQARGHRNGAAASQYVEETWDITTMEGLARLVRLACQEVKDLAMVVVDPVGWYLARTREGIEDTELIAKAGRAMAQALGISVVMVQHSNAQGDRARGTDHLNARCDTSIRMEQIGSKEIAMVHHRKNRGGTLQAMRFEKLTVGPGPILNATRGMAGDEYTPEDVGREQEERRSEGKQRRQVAAAENPAYWERILNVLEPEGTGSGVSLTQAGPLAGMKSDLAKGVLGVLVRDGKVVRRAGLRGGAYHWRAM